MKRTLVVDIETYSSADLARGGSYKYAEAEDFEILLMSYAYDDDPVQVWDFTCNGVPPWLVPALLDPDVLKVAWNMSFERNCFNLALGIYSPPEQWRDAMTMAAMNGLPMSLEAAGAALQLIEQKLDTGKALIRYFCVPCKPTKANGGRTRNLPEHAPEKWEQFVKYCRRDTEAERTIYQRLQAYEVPEQERRVECMDARINERGVMIDIDLVRAAIKMDDALKVGHTKELQILTGLGNPNSVAQLKTWLSARGLHPDSLDKKTVSDLIGKVSDPTTKRVLRLRQLLGKSSTAKYSAMMDAVCNDQRVRGLLQYYGAGRTGRWAGRRVQLQNLAQNHLDQIETVREIVKAGDLEGLELLYDNVPDVLAQLIRTAIVPGEGKTFLVADYHAIEAVCIAYLANERWRLDVFSGDGKIYEASYAQAFGVPKDSVKKGSPERQKGKIMELALGYGGGPSALLAFGADKLGLDPDQLQELVDKWRAASPSITRFWRSAEKAAKAAIRQPGKVFRLQNGCAYTRDKDALRLILPSGRRLSYWGAYIDDDSGGLHFWAQNQTTRKWQRTETWGGRLVENIVQAYARDILAEAMLRLEDAGYPVVFSVHDEVVVEAPEGSDYRDVERIMAQPVSWAPGLDKYLTADGMETHFYRK